MKALGTVAAGELAIQLVQARKAIREGIAYDLPFDKGKPENVARDMWTMGSGISAPWPTLATHAALTGMLLVKPRPWLRRALGVLGVVYVVGYLGERVVRESFRRPNGNLTVFNAIAILLAMVMVVLGLLRRS
jgi:prolipoprotein diacylglyceryltransferase